MAAAMSLANYVKRMCYVDYPLFVPGSSQKSLAGVSGMRKHVGRLCDQRHLPPSCEATWSEIIPKFFSVQTIWGEALVNALRANGRDDLLPRLNIPRYYADCLRTHPGYAADILRQFPRALRATGTGLPVGLLRLFTRLLRHPVGRTKAVLARILGIRRTTEMRRVGALGSIEDAVVAFSKCLEEMNVRFRDTVASSSPEA
jgi:hypothetical protein